MHPSRRRLLGILGTLGVGALAGCNDSAVDTDDPSAETGTPTPIPTDTPIEYQQRTFADDDGDGEDRFGWSVALSSDGTSALVGANTDEDPNGAEAGSAYVFE
ncbi:hypothetical protein BRC92_10870 [Halobacteriales archaeon QS_4_69_31]|nr:MAG: hypothetical protein BRC92_10870 [Halobacteriales archaeon QS_4_69_31]